MDTVKFQVVDYKSPEYWAAVALRESILRRPLGLIFTDEELAAERDHMQITGVLYNNIIATSSLVIEGMWCKMQRVAVQGDWQARGVGSRMLAFCEAYACSQGCEWMYCHARSTAVRFYFKNGYSAVGEVFEEDGISHMKMHKSMGC